MFGNPGWSGVQSSHQVDSEKLPGKSLSHMEKVQSHQPFCKPQTQHGLSSAYGLLTSYFHVVIKLTDL